MSGSILTPFATRALTPPHHHLNIRHRRHHHVIKGITMNMFSMSARLVFLAAAFASCMALSATTKLDENNRVIDTFLLNRGEAQNVKKTALLEELSTAVASDENPRKQKDEEFRKVSD